jgi:hypothetical protein
MHRRTFLAGTAAVFLSTPLAVEAQPAGKVYRIALLPDVRPALEPLLKIVTETLSELGRIEGRDFVFYRTGIFYGDDTDRAVREAINAKPDLIFGFNLGYIVAAHKLTKTIPIVMWVSGFPVEHGPMKALVGILVATTMVFASGCAKQDWIDRTLVTVDVTGVWRGVMTVGGQNYDWELTLQQVGPKVTGRLRQVLNPTPSGPIEGTVNGDMFHFRTSRGATGNLQVNGDEMTGTGSGVTGASQATFSLRRQPQ